MSSGPNSMESVRGAWQSYQRWLQSNPDVQSSRFLRLQTELNDQVAALAPPEEADATEAKSQAARAAPEGSDRSQFVRNFASAFPDFSKSIQAQFPSSFIQARRLQGQQQQQQQQQIRAIRAPANPAPARRVMRPLALPQPPSAAAQAGYTAPKPPTAEWKGAPSTTTRGAFDARKPPLPQQQQGWYPNTQNPWERRPTPRHSPAKQLFDSRKPSPARGGVARAYPPAQASHYALEGPGARERNNPYARTLDLSNLR